MVFKWENTDLICGRENTPPHFAESQAPLQMQQFSQNYTIN